MSGNDMRMGPFGYPIAKSMRCNQKTVGEYLRCNPRGATKHHLRFGMDGIGGQVFTWSQVTRVIDAMIKNGKVYKRGEYYLLSEDDHDKQTTTI
jgi:hypothetical protein